jgi:hypothetical protein
LTVTPSSLTLEVGETRTLQAGNNVGPLTWYSGNEAVAKVARTNVSATTVTAVGPGTAIIYVSDQSTKEVVICTVRVTGGTTPDPAPPTPTPPIPTPTLTVTPSTLPLEVGNTGTLTAANYTGNVEWLTSDASIATVVGSGTTATVTGIAVGRAEITVMDDSGADATCAVTVTEAEEDSLPPEEETIFFDTDGKNVYLENAVYQPNIHNAEANNVVSAKYAGQMDKDRGIAPQEMMIRNTNKIYVVGDVIAVPPSENSTYGFVAVVETIQEESNGTQTLSLRQASIGDLLLEGDLFFTSHSTVDSMLAQSSARKTPPVKAQGILADLIDKMDYVIQLEKQESFSISASASLNAEMTKAIKEKAEVAVNFKLEATPKITFTTGVSFYVSIKDAVLERLKITFPYEWKKDLEAKFSGKLSLQDTGDWYITPKIKVLTSFIPTPLGPVPYSIDYATIAKMSAGMEGSFSVAYEESSGGCYGFDFDAQTGVTTPINTKSLGNSGGTLPQPPSIDVKAKFELGPKVFFNVAFIDLVSTKATAGIALQYTLTEPKIVLKKVGTVNATMDLMKFIASQFPKNKNQPEGKLSFSYDFIKIEEEIFNWEINPNPTPPTGDNWIDVANINWYDSPYKSEFEISNAYQLAGLAKLANGGTSFSGKTIRLTDNIYLAGKQWTPIALFAGTFDGGGHTIAGLTINNSVAYTGLFGRNSGTIKNVYLTELDISSSAGSYLYTGGLVGYNSETIAGCTVSGNVSYSSSISSVPHIGGVVGYNMGEITNCKSSGNVSSSSSSPPPPSSPSGGYGANTGYAGGIAGVNDHRGGTVANCESSANVAVDGSGADAGGIVGSNGGSITNCKSSGTVSASSYAAPAEAGGIAGRNYGGTVTDCDSSGNISSSNSHSTAMAGGCVGINAGLGTIEGDCTASGAVSASSTNPSSYYNGVSRAGGFVGSNEATIKDDCTASGAVSASSIAGPSYAGGFAGRNGGTVTDCGSSGAVSASSNFASYVAGFAGYFSGGATRCVARGKEIRASGGGTQYKGGFIGYFNSYTTFTGNSNETEVKPDIGYNRITGGPVEDLEDL